MAFVQIINNPVIVLFFLFFWFFHIARRNFFWLSFLQLKEYRFDRLFDGVRENKRILFPPISIFALLLLLFLFFSLPFEILHYISISLSLLLYFLLGARSIYFIFRKEWILPKFTQKMTLLLVLIALLETFFGGKLSILFWRTLLSPFLYFGYLFLFEVLFPFFIFFCAGLVQVPVFFIKKCIIKKAREKRKKMREVLVIGITGSYGKTSTKEFLFELLSQKYKVLKTPVNQNTEIGVARTILEDLKKEHEIFICEMAAYKKGEIKAICDITHPKIGILTGISGQHVSLFGSLKNIISTKYELVASLPKDGIAIFNGTNEECQKLAQRANIKKYIYSLQGGNSDVFARNIKETPDSIEFKIETFKGNEEIRLNLLGKHNIENFLGAVTCALHLGISLRTIQEVAPNIKPSKTSIRKKRGENDIIIIDDSYSQNPDGVFAAIDYIKTYKEGRKIILMPCLIELGKSAPSIHKSVGRAIGKTFDLAIITTPFYFEEIKIGAMESSMSEGKILFSNNPEEISEKVEPYFSSENVILIEGRVNERIIKGLT